MMGYTTDSSAFNGVIWLYMQNRQGQSFGLLRTG